MMDLRQSTASQEIDLGYFLDSTDGDTEETGLTIANTDIKLRKHGGTTLINKNSGGATHISNGIYHATLDATDTNTAGMLTVYVHVAGALPVKATFNVMTASAYDAKYTGTYNNLSASDVLTTALTESYRADAAEGTLTQILYEVIAHLGESSISGTTKTISEIDGTTTAATFTMDSATTPTSITRNT